MILVKFTPIKGTTSRGRTTYMARMGTSPANRPELCRMRARNIDECEEAFETIVRAAMNGMTIDGTTRASAPSAAQEDPRQMTLPGVGLDESDGPDESDNGNSDETPHD